LNFATIVDLGNPQTLVWREPRAPFAPAFPNLEAISRASYFDMDQHAAAMRYSTEENALAQLAAVFSQISPTTESKVF
jgi:hypothetical protein